MLIVGAKGFAKEVLEILFQNDISVNTFFFDDTNSNTDKLFDFPILKNAAAVHELFKKDNEFTLGVGNPKTRFELYKRFIELGGKFKSTISPFSNIGHYGNIIGDGCNIMTGTVITNDVTIQTGCLINLNCTIGHDSYLGMFTELSPGVSISGNCTIGSFCTIGTNATILPKIKLGNNVTVGAGAVVTRDFAEDVTVVGIPAKEVHRNED